MEKAAPGTIRGDLALDTQDNLVHGSDSPESAAREIALWFPGSIAARSQPGPCDHRWYGILAAGRRPPHQGRTPE